MTAASMAVLAHRMAQLAAVSSSVALFEDRQAPSNAQANQLVDRIRTSHRLDIRPPSPDISDTAKAVRRPFYDALADLAATWGKDRTRLRDLKQRRKTLEREIERLEAALNKGAHP